MHTISSYIENNLYTCILFSLDQLSKCSSYSFNRNPISNKQIFSSLQNTNGQINNTL